MSPDTSGQIPSVKELTGVLAASQQLQELARVYSRIMAGQPYRAEATANSFGTQTEFMQATAKLEKYFNPARLPFPERRRTVVVSGWPYRVLDALKWLESGVRHVIDHMGWHGLCEGKSVAVMFQPGHGETTIEVSGDQVRTNIDANTFTWPHLDEQLVAQIEEANKILADALLPHQILQPKEDVEKKTRPRMPDNQDVRDLCFHLSKNAGKGKALIKIAREFTRESPGDDRKAKSLLRQARRFAHLWRTDK